MNVVRRRGAASLKQARTRGPAALPRRPAVSVIPVVQEVPPEAITYGLQVEHRSRRQGAAARRDTGPVAG